MIQKPQVLSTRLLCLAGSPWAPALVRQQESKARSKLGINSERGSAQRWMLIYTTVTNRHFPEKSEPRGVSAALLTAVILPKRKAKAGRIYWGEGKHAYLVELGKEIFIGKIISNIAIFFSTILQSPFLPVQFFESIIQAYSVLWQQTCICVSTNSAAHNTKSFLTESTYSRKKKKGKPKLTYSSVQKNLFTFKRFHPNEIIVGGIRQSFISLSFCLVNSFQ